MKKRKIAVGILIAALTMSVAAPALAEPSVESNDGSVAIYATASAGLAVKNGFGQGTDGSWYYYEDGQIDTDCNDVIKDEEKQIDASESWWYVVGGKVQSDFTGLADYRNANGWWYIKDGKVDFTHNGVDKNKNGWWYVVGGKVQKGFTGLADYKNANGWWYIENGKVDFTHTGVDRNANGWWYVENGKVDLTHNGVDKNANGWWYILNGKVQFDFTGLANYRNANGWWYIKDGKVDFTTNTVAKNNNGWWYIKDGKVDLAYTGFGKNKNGEWYCEDGKVKFDKYSVIKDASGALGTKGKWYYVVGGEVQTDYTGVADYKNANGWWYIKKSAVDFSAHTVAKNSNGWWYVKNGKVDFSFNGIAKNGNGWWYIQEGKVDFSHNGSVKVAGGTFTVVNGEVRNVDLSSTAVARSSDASHMYDYDVAESDIKYGGTDTNKLAAPQFTGTVLSSGGIKLTWDAVSGAEKYRVFRREYGGTWTKVADTTSTTYTDYLWTDYTLYQYTVRCVNSAGTEYTSPYISGFSGSAIAEYGQLYVGNPYVYAGTSLTDGCDCSGFTMQVYAHFGYYMPHYSGTQITFGKEVSDANAQPGDLVGRSGHVALAIGDGKVVQARGSAYGICITKLSEVNHSTVRRIL